MLFHARPASRPVAVTSPQLDVWSKMLMSDALMKIDYRAENERAPVNAMKTHRNVEDFAKSKHRSTRQPGRDQSGV